MKNNKSNKTSFISDIKLNTKSAIVNSLYFLSCVVLIAAMARGIYFSQEKRHSDMQKKLVTTSEQIMEMIIDSGVNIAKSIYINEEIYTFLNTEYKSSADYYDYFYNLQRNNPMSIANTNIINHYVLYTENPTILTGGNISSFSTAYGTDWYHEYKKLNKPMILYVDHKTNVVSIIRKLDFKDLTTGESCLKLDLNMRLLTDYCDSLDFDGKFYIINGGSLIYSNVADTSVENADINTDFECYIKNYYTADIEYYAYENRDNAIDYILDNIVFIIIFIVIFIIIVITGFVFNNNIKKRIKHSVEIIINENKVNSYTNGKDEIGEILDMCIKTYERITEHDTHNKIQNEELQQNSSLYQELFTTAMQIDAELTVAQRYPAICRRYSGNIPIESEIDNISQITKDISISGSTDMTVPAYSLFMIAEDLYSPNLSISVSYSANSTEINFRTNAIKQSKLLKLNAIFEENNISNAYSFGYNNPYNPYMRLMHCLGNRMTIKIKNKNNFNLCLIIKSEKSDYHEF